MRTAPGVIIFTMSKKSPGLVGTFSACSPRLVGTSGACSPMQPCASGAGRHLPARPRTPPGADWLLLNNEQEIGLLGISPLSEKLAEAKNFIIQKTRGKKVFLKVDQEIYDAEGRLLCYLYLSDMTFINAHLIKRGLAVVDQSFQHRHARRFLKYQEEFGTIGSG